MNAASITALVTALVALLGAVGTFLAQLGHIQWHKNNPVPEQTQIGRAPGVGTKP